MATPASRSPVARQNVAVGHETPVNHACGAPAGAGAVTIDHAVPFQRSMNGVRDGSSPDHPTAKQSAAPEHDTSTILGGSGVAGAAIGTKLHAEPFQRSAASWRGKPAVLAPSARHVVGAGHVTAVSESAGGASGLGFAATVQLGAALAGGMATTPDATHTAVARHVRARIRRTFGRVIDPGLMRTANPPFDGRSLQT